MVVEYDARQIEVQLRTFVMHQWAVTVERVTSRLGVNLKGDGDHAVQDLLRVISQAMAIEEQDGVVDTSLLEEMHHLRELAAPYLQGGA